MAVTTAVIAENTARVKGQNCVSVVTDVCPTVQIEEDASLLIIISITIKKNIGRRKTIMVVQFEYSIERNLRNWRKHACVLEDHY